MPEIDLRKNILVSGSFRIVVITLSFFVSWIIARYLGVELKGEYSYVITLGGFIWIVLDLGLYHSFPYLLRKNPAKTISVFSWTLYTFVAENLVLIALGLAFLPFWNRVMGYQFQPFYFVLFVLYLTLTKAFMQLQGLHIGRDKILHNSISTLLNTGFCLLLLLAAFLVLRDFNRLAVVLGATDLALAAGVVYLVLRNRWGNWPLKPDFSYIKYAYSFGLRAFFCSLVISLLLRSDIVIVKYLLGFREVGIYSIAAHIVDMLQVASNMVGALLLAKLSDTEDEVSKWILMKKMLMVFFVFLCLGNLGFLILGKFLLAITFGPDFVPSYWVYLWLIPAGFGLSFGSLFNNYLNSKGFPLISTLLPALALLLNVALNFLFIPRLGVNGAAISTSIAYLMWFFLIIAYEQKLTQGRLTKHLIPTRQDWYELWNGGVTLVQDARNRLLRKRSDA